MTEMDAETLRKELEQYRTERDKIRALIGQIGGVANTRRDRTLNIIFIALVLTLFSLDIVRYAGWLPKWPEMISLELALLLLSFKIIWMIHQQARVEHFQFWILNAIEFRLNEMSRRFQTIEKSLKQGSDPH